MSAARRGLLRIFATLDAGLDRVFTPAGNPLKQLGALGFLCLWIVIVTGVHLYIGFDTSVAGAYASVERLSHSAWFLAGVSRSLHRYASDGLVLMMLLHFLREFAHDRHRGARWFSWITGSVALVLVYGAGIGGYWLVWDRLAQFIAIATTEWIDYLPIFGEPIARNFVAPGALDDRFFTLLIFLHIALPLILALVLWMHLQRISGAAMNPPRRVTFVATFTLVALAIAFPALSQAPADLARVPARLGLDWFYLVAYPAIDHLPPALTWPAGGLLFTLFLGLPWFGRRPTPNVARVDLDFCNGCGRCHADCPYAAITLVPRRDGKPFEHQAEVDSSLCVGCGICVGACPPSTPFRSDDDLRTGIDLPGPNLRDLRAATLAAVAALPAAAPRILVFGCRHGVAAAGGPGMVSLPCLAMLPPSFIDFALSRTPTDGVVLAGCDDCACHNRFGQLWTEERIAGTRDPRLRTRVPRDRLATCWAGPLAGDVLRDTRAALAARIADTGSADK